MKTVSVCVVHVFRGRGWRFQQDGASVHRARTTQVWFKREALPCGEYFCVLNFKRTYENGAKGPLNVSGLTPRGHATLKLRLYGCAPVRCGCSAAHALLCFGR